MSTIEPRMASVPVDGGALRIGRWGSGEQVVVASHGITANHRSFAGVAAALQAGGHDVTLVGIDHRGRGGSRAVPGPWGPRVHARDVVAVLDHLAAPQAVLVGHSMGAFVVATAAELAPDRVRGLVLVDGALPVEVALPPDAAVEDVVRSVIGPALDRLERTFDTPDDYVAYWQDHPAVGGSHFTAVAEDHVRYDLVREGEAWRCGVDRQAVLFDGRELLLDTRAATVLARIATPSTLLWAPRGMLDQSPGLFRPEVVAAAAAPLSHVETVLVPDVNHYTILLGAAGAATVAEHVVRHLDGRPGGMPG